MKEKRQEKKGLSKNLKRFFGVGDFGFGFMANLETYFFAIFLTDIAQLSVALSGIVMTVTSVVDTILAPFYGAIINAVKPKKWGRYRSWLIITLPVVFIFYLLQWTKIGSDQTAAIIITIGFIVSHIAWNLPWVANVTLISVIGQTDEERILLSSNRSLGTTISKVIFSMIAAPAIAAIGRALGSEISGYTVFAAIGAGMMCLGYYLHFVMTEGYEEVEEVEEKEEKEEKGEIKEKKKDSSGMLNSLIKNPPLIVLLFADFGKFLVAMLVASMAAYYFKYVFENEMLLAPFLTVSALGGVVGSYIVKPMGKKFSSRVSTIIMFFVLGVSLVICRIFYLNMVVFFVGMFIVNLCAGALNALFIPLYSNTIIYGEWKTGKNFAGFVMGLQTMPLKLSIVFRGIVVAAVLGGIGYIAGDAVSSAVKVGIANGMTVVPLIAVVISLVLFVFGYRLTNEKIKEMQEEIAARKIETV